MNNTPTTTDFVLHYKCQFALTSVEDGDPLSEKIWNEASRLIYWWVKQCIVKSKDEEFISLGSFRLSAPEGRAKTQNGSRIVTRASGGEAFPPAFWTCQLEHPENAFPHRRWRVDIGLTYQARKAVEVAIRVCHGLIPGYIGPEPVRPDIRAPRLVTTLLDSPLWSACLGNLRLRSKPILAESGKHLWDQLRNPQRRGPIVVLAAAMQGEYALSPMNLSKQLSGVAAVWLLPYEMQDEFLSPYYAGNTHYCKAGTIRIYQPGLVAGSEADGRRHRFLPNSFVEEQGSEAVLRLIVSALIRQTNYRDTPAIFSPEELEQQQRTDRLEQLRQQLDGNSVVERLSAEDREYFSLLEEDNRLLNIRLQQASRDKNEEELALLEQNETLAEQVRQLKFKMQSLEIDTQRVKEKNTTETITRLAQLWQDTKTLPKTVEDVLELAEQCWSEQLVFTNRAKKSVKETQFSDVNVLWQTLWHMAHTLHPLYFGDNTLPFKEIEQRFDSTATSLSLTHGETKITRDNAELMKLRQDTYNGQQLDIEPHVKYGTKAPKLLRVHYHRDVATRRLIIGHCGDHMLTHGSQFQ